MTSFDKTELGIRAKDLGFIRDTLEKVLRLNEILSFINSDPLLAQTLALKGGTAINLTVFDLPRLSVDIDLDYCRNDSLEEMTANRKQITEVLGRYLVSAGYHPSSKTREHHSLDGMVWAYTNAAGVNDNIKVEINYSMRAHLFPTEQRQIMLPSSGTVTTLAPVEIFASKIVALLTRAAARDLYDIDRMVQTDLFAGDLDQLRSSVVFYLAVGTDVVPDPTDFSRLHALTPRKIRTDLQPVLRKRDWFDLSAAQHRVTDFLASLLQLNASEQKFIDAFNNGEWKPELILRDEALSRVANHPMAVWKLELKQGLPTSSD
ncbi:MAG: nucleotidyl transferase AbiEii/AbiGii toxin family protein [Propionibacteriaceae bacterium]|jgi:predicted nucleotidyltransferase component of viral defense system|nr:nucleotidyl transferase AbiEii/AbiGii toxin family protein [Propionibacteriaceae bacterium]